MKKTLLAFLFAFVFCAMATAQQPTRNQLLKLYYEANSALNSDNVDQAVAKYEEIISLTPRYSDPYLRLAQICEQHSENDTIMLSKAILMYRMYVNIELDDAKAEEATVRLRVLEDKINAAHFDEQLKAEEVDLDEYALSPEIPEEALAGEYLLGLEVEVGDDEFYIEDEEINLKREKIKAPQLVLMVPKNAASSKESSAESEPATNKLSISDIFKNPYEVKIVKGKARSAALFIGQSNLESLTGRWVSLSRLGEGREAWIVDISLTGENELRVTLNTRAGIFDIPQWQQNIFNERSSLKSYANDATCVTTQPDITMGTMKMMSHLKSFVADGKLKDGQLSFTYNIDLHYTPTEGKYNMMRQGVGLFSSLLGGLIGVDLSTVTSVADVAIGVAEQRDTDMHYTGNIEYSLSLDNNMLTGTCHEFLMEEKGTKTEVKKDRTFDVQFIKVSDDYEGYEGNPFVRTKFDLAKEKAILKSIRSEYSMDDPKIQYLLGVLYSYRYGQKDFTGRQEFTKAALYQLRKAADLGSVEAKEMLADYYFKLSLGDESKRSPSLSSSMNSILSANVTMPPKKVRKSSYDMANQYLAELKEVAPDRACNVEAEYWITKNHDVAGASKLFKKSMNPQAMNRLGEINLNEYQDPNTAVHYFTTAADEGNPEAMLNIAKLHRDGKGVSYDPEAYIKWILKSYENGNVNALDELADAYMRGIGVEPDYERAVIYVDMKRQVNYAWCNWLIYNYCPKLFEQ